MKGSISFVNRSDGYHKSGIWEASIFLNGRRLRKRSAHREVCAEWLEEVNLHMQEWTPKFTIVEEGDPKYLMRYRNNPLNMEQRQEKLKRLITEAGLVLEYWQTRDFSAITAYVEKTVMPELLAYFANEHRPGFRVPETRRHEIVYNALAVFYTRLYADHPIYNFTGMLKKMCRIYLQRGDFWYYDLLPEPVHRIVENVDYSILATKFVVKSTKK
ncbi:MAG: hypothetical protein IJQ38_04755 [Bacteroidaceae bacterium]|nr:hypothetical protein [Bacteroidaceae bacterium]